jgi:hypothetical protein
VIPPGRKRRRLPRDIERHRDWTLAFFDERLVDAG